jgi:hypothetical protein
LDIKWSCHYQHYSIDDRIINEHGAVGEIKIDRGNQSIWRKPAAVPLYPLHIPQDLTCYQTQAAAMGSQWLTASAMAWPNGKTENEYKCRIFNGTLWKRIVKKIRKIYREFCVDNQNKNGLHLHIQWNLNYLS